MEKKKRKNRQPIIVVAMLLMVALVVGMGAMTYSRYVSSFNSVQQATAAKWGYVITANADSLFGTQYGEDNADKQATIDETGKIVVKASADGKVVAPGTTGSMTITVSGQAEVRAKLTIEVATGATTIMADGILIGNSTYTPVEWTVTKNSSGVETTETGADLSACLNTLVADATYAPNSTELDDTYTIEWAWALNDDNDDASAKDTIIGYAAAEKSWNDVKDALLPGNKKVSDYIGETDYGEIVTQLSFSLSVTIEQIQ